MFTVVGFKMTWSLPYKKIISGLKMCTEVLVLWKKRRHYPLHNKFKLQKKSVEPKNIENNGGNIKDKNSDTIENGTAIIVVR